MPDGKTHFAANIAWGLAMTGISAWYAPELVAPVAVGAVIGTFVTPDADVDHASYPEALLRRIPLVGLLFQTLWYPYGLLMPHRGASHWPVLGTLGRLAYMLTILFFVGLVVIGLPTGSYGAWLRALLACMPWAQAAAVLAAWIMQDLAHIALDGLIRG